MHCKRYMQVNMCPNVIKKHPPEQFGDCIIDHDPDDRHVDVLLNSFVENQYPELHWYVTLDW